MNNDIIDGLSNPTCLGQLHNIQSSIAICFLIFDVLY